MGFKTLIIIDNSSYLTTLNREIIKETVKYILKNAPENDSMAVAVTGENAEYLCEYDDSLSTKLKTSEDISFADINASMTDVLMDILLNWKNDDLAMRDIIVISGSDITKNAEYTLEELFFEIGSKEYPIYTITCQQEDNISAVKTIASLSRLSGAVSIDISDAKEDAGVEKQLGDRLLAAMKEKHEQYEKNMDEADSYDEDEFYDENEEEGGTDGYEDKTSAESEEELTEKVEDTYSGTGNEIQVERQSNMIYQLPDRNAGLVKLVVPALFIVVSSIIAYLLLKRKGNKDREEEERYLRKVTPVTSGSIDISERLPFEDIGNMSNVTMSLGTYDDDEDTGTRLLYQSKEGVEITLEDRANPTKYFRLCVRDSIVIGRNPKVCDVVIDYDDSVSSKHCEFYLRGESVYLRDLNSSNGTMINQQKIYQEVKLESGDILRIGRLSFFVQILGGVNG